MPTLSPRPRIDARSRSRALQQDVMEIIHARGLGPGDPLPTEIELVEALGVGRNTVREALKALQAIGVLDIRHGYGTFVAQKRLEAVATPLEFHARLSLRATGHEALELVDVRQALESGLIASACDAMTSASLESVREAVARMESDAAAGRSLTQADHDFHSALFAPLGNRLLSELLEVFWKTYSSIHEQVSAGGSGRGGAQEAAETARDHRRILEAVEAGDRVEAARLLERHFDGIRSLIAAVTERQGG